VCGACAAFQVLRIIACTMWVHVLFIFLIFFAHSALLYIAFVFAYFLGIVVNNTIRMSKSHEHK